MRRENLGSKRKERETSAGLYAIDEFELRLGTALGASTGRAF